MDAEVVRKDGLLLIREMSVEVKNMLDIKMNAVMVSSLLIFHNIRFRSSVTTESTLPEMLSLNL